VGEGTIVVKRDCEISELSKASAKLSTGETIAADIIICGTGWQQEVPFLDKATQAKIMDNKGNFRLYKCVLPPNVSGLAFNGYNSSFFSPLSAEIGSLWIAAYLANDIKLPSVDQQIVITDERLRWMEERTEGKHARGTNIIPFSMHQVDELLEDIRLPISFGQRFMEWQMPIKPSSYSKIRQKLKKRLKVA
jgi:dimethylaniline monooxygenase (N-oxide forming)